MSFSNNKSVNSSENRLRGDPYGILTNLLSGGANYAWPIYTFGSCAKCYQRVCPQDHAQYFLGSIAPDSIHVFVNAARSKRIASHLMADDILMHESDNIETRANAVRFYRNAEKNMSVPKSFKLGYSIHILTDIYWLRTVYLKFLFLDIIKDMEISESDKIYSYEMNKSSCDLLETEVWRADVFRLLSDAVPPNGCLAVTAEEIDRWRSRTLDLYGKYENMHSEPVKYLLPEDIRCFLKTAREYIIEALNECHGT